MRLFYGKDEDIERLISKLVNKFVFLIKKDKKLRKFIKVFGITGPAGRGQASFGKSDIDFYCITNKLCPLKEKYLKEKFNECFKEMDYEFSLLSFAPSILKKNDLMFFEFATSGKILYGKLDRKIKIENIPKWEGIRLLTFKGNPFLANLGTDKELYYFSKLILGIGESFLLLDNKYVADDFKRRDLIIKNKYAKTIKGFIALYRKAFDYRYNGKKIMGIKDIEKEGLKLWQIAWKIYLENYFGCSYEKALSKLKRIKPGSFLKIIGTRVFYTLNYWQYFKKIRICCKEPFIQEVLMIQRYFKNPSIGLKKKITESWKVSPRFWYGR